MSVYPIQYSNKYLGYKSHGDCKMTTTPATSNPLMMGGRIPGSTFQLPSRGLFYENGELEQGTHEGEVHVFPMSGYDEIIMKTPDLLFNGQAIEQVFSRCIPAIKKPLRLLARDVDYLLICLRSVAYGNNVDLIHNHGCENGRDNKYSVSIEEFMKKTKQIDPTIYATQYCVTMPDRRKCFLNPLRYDAVVDMMTESISEREDYTPIELHTEMSSRLAGLINRVVIPQDIEDDIVVSNPDQILEWIQSLIIPLIKVLNDGIEKIADWGPDTSFTVQCKDCSKDMVVVAPLNPMHFFT